MEISGHSSEQPFSEGSCRKRNEKLPNRLFSFLTIPRFWLQVLKMYCFLFARFYCSLQSNKFILGLQLRLVWKLWLALSYFTHVTLKFYIQVLSVPFDLARQLHNVLVVPLGPLLTYASSVSGD